MATVTLADVGDNVQIISRKWLHSIRQYAANVDTLYKHGTINAALSNIGTSTQTTIIVTENFAVNTNTDLTSYPNISWVFWGSGKLTPAVGITLTLYSPETISCPPEHQCLDASSGTISFAKSGWVWPGWFGAYPGVSAASAFAALTKLSTAFGSLGCGIWWPARTIQVSDTIAFTGPLTIRGVSQDTSILETTADATNKHGLTVTRSHDISNFQVKTSADLTQNRTMAGIRCDLDGVTVSGGGLSIRYENVKVRGFNIGLSADGGDAYNVALASLNNVDVKVAGPASDYVASCVYMHRVQQLTITNSLLDQNNTGEHPIYCFGSKNIVIDNVRAINATRTDVQAIKIVGNGVAPDDDQAYGSWSIRNIDMENCSGGLVCTVFGTEELGSLTIQNVRAKDIDGTANILGNVLVTGEDTAIVRSILIDNCDIRNTGYQGVHLAFATGATMGRATIRNITGYNWSTSSAGTYTLFGTSGDCTFGPIDLDNIVADGNSNGRTIVGTVGQGANITRINVRNLKEVNTTSPGLPAALATGDATPSMMLGNIFTQGNGSAQNISAYDHLAPNQTYIVRFTTGNTTLLDGSNLNLASSSNYNPPANAVVTFFSPDGTALWEVSRSAD